MLLCMPYTCMRRRRMVYDTMLMRRDDVRIYIYVPMMRIMMMSVSTIMHMMVYVHVLLLP